ncbi:hypothetical protein [Streptomyces sviceus]|uniref:hypothetical protein n=1 Tax=Streptomyces sviceus TaxID=285530 RepID=UPI0036CEC243
MLTEVDPERLARDAEHPTRPTSKPVFIGGQVPQEVHWDRGDLVGPVGVASKEAGAPRLGRADSFTRPAASLHIGDDLQTHPRFPEHDMGLPDEGCHRVAGEGHRLLLLARAGLSGGEQLPGYLCCN